MRAFLSDREARPPLLMGYQAFSMFDARRVAEREARAILGETETPVVVRGFGGSWRLDYYATWHRSTPVPVLPDAREALAEALAAFVAE